MELSEKEIEDLIYNDLTSNFGYELLDRGLQLDYHEFTDRTSKVKWFRQLNIDPYGIIDIVGFYRMFGSLCVELIELKKTPIELNHFEQISRYRKGLDVYLKNTFKNVRIRYSMSIIGSDYNGFYLQNILPIDVYTFSLELTGITFSLTHKYSTWHRPDGNNKSFKIESATKVYSNGQKI